MIASDPVPTALAEIARLLRQGDDSDGTFEKQAHDIEMLRDSALASDSVLQEQFRTEITKNGWFWLGMGTIADIAFRNKERNAQFIRAYLALARACESAGLESEYSSTLKDTFGKWVREGLV